MTANRHAGISGLGKYLPKRKITNEELAVQCGVTAEWIETRTGILSRHYAEGTETASAMGAEAAKKALADAKISASEIGLIITCTYSGDYQLPALACKIQQLLGASNAGAFDLSAGSAGFIAALTIASDRIRLDSHLKHVLIVTVSHQSPFLNKKDAKSAVLFGDGAAAAIVSACAPGSGMLESYLFSQGEAFEALRLRGGGSSFPLTDTKEEQFYLEMDGPVVGKQYMKFQPEVIDKVLTKAGVSIDKIDLFIFHQANFKIIQILMGQMNLDTAKTFTNVEHYGNTSDASVALALCEAVEQGKVRPGNLVLLSGVGAGMIFNTCLLRWF